MRPRKKRNRLLLLLHWNLLRFTDLTIRERLESSHLLVEFKIQNDKQQSTLKKSDVVRKLLWNTEKTDIFLRNIYLDMLHSISRSLLGKCQVI